MKTRLECSRCHHVIQELPIINGRHPTIERHHIIFKCEGGDNSESNLIYMCTYCHDFYHAEADLLQQLSKEKCIYEKFKKKSGSIWDGRGVSMRKSRERVRVLKNRIKVLNELNSIDNIVIYGYRSYWTTYIVV